MDVNTMRTMKRDEAGAVEPLFLLVGVLVIVGIAALLVVLDLWAFAAAGVLFFFGGLILLQGTPLRGWLGVLVGAVLLIVAVAIGVVFG